MLTSREYENIFVSLTAHVHTSLEVPAPAGSSQYGNVSGVASNWHSFGNTIHTVSYSVNNEK